MGATIVGIAFALQLVVNNKFWVKSGEQSSVPRLESAAILLDVESRE